MTSEGNQRGFVRALVSCVSHSYGTRIVLKNVSLELQAGQIYGLLGPNGAGKTTLMKTLSGHLLPTCGQVLVDGADPYADKRARKAVSYIPQDIAIFPHLTATENLEIFGRLSGVAGEALRLEVASIVEKAALGQNAARLCRTLSGGFQRRVNICAGLLSNPAVIVLDEPTVGIDIGAREAIHGLLQKLRDDGAAILIATHDLEQAQLLADRIGLMKDGELLLEGEPAKLIADTFGRNQEVIVVLDQPASRQQIESLHAFGLQQSQSLLSWFGSVAPDQIDPSSFNRALSARGLLAREIRIRRPDLNSLFLAFAGKPESTQ